MSNINNNSMSIIDKLTLEIECHSENYDEGTVLFTHPFLDDCYARVNVKFDGWNWNQQWTYAFDPLWSSDDTFDVKELVKSAKELWIEKVSEYEEEKRERDEVIKDCWEHYMDY